MFPRELELAFHALYASCTNAVGGKQEYFTVWLRRVAFAKELKGKIDRLSSSKILKSCYLAFSLDKNDMIWMIAFP
ncbi:hypothetical protein A9P85_14370 [Legionella pneumophila]|nr:hypothetical protein A9P85_14370 [Legionella pneumophila]